MPRLDHKSCWCGEAARRYEGGESACEIARSLGRPNTTIYSALRAHGVPRRPRPGGACDPWPWRRMSTEERFWRHTEPEPMSGCWLWTGQVFVRRDGPRAIFALGGKLVPAARVAYRLARGVDPGDLFVCHKCDNGLCVAPSHLFLGTATDNNHDMRAKGRHAYGERHWTRLYPGRLKLTPDLVRDIRRRSATEKAGVIANDFGVSRGLVRLVATGKRWAHVK